MNRLECIGREGLILGIHGDKAKVRLLRQSACENCGACSMIGGKEFEFMAKVPKELSQSLEVGDSVIVELPTGGAMKAAFIMYVIPLLLLFVGLGIGYALNLNEMISFVIGISMFALYYIFIRFNRAKFEADKRYTAIIKSRITEIKTLD